MYLNRFVSDKKNTIELLLKNGADVHAVEHIGGRTALLSAIIYGNYEYMNMQCKIHKNI